MPYNSAYSIGGDPGPTTQIASTDAAQGLPAALQQISQTQPAVGALVSVENNSIRFALGVVVPTQGLGHLLTAGQSYLMSSPKMVQSFQFCSAAVGTPAIVHVPPLF